MAASSFIFGGNTGLSQEDLKRRRQVLDAIVARQSTPKNIGEGINALGQGLLNGLEGRSIRNDEEAFRANQAAFSADADQTLAGGFGAAGPGAGFASATGPIADATTPAAASDARYTMGNAAREISTKPSDAGIYDQFIGTVKDSGLTNPFGLAAVAATGQAESGYSPKNTYGEWADPSESGKSGQAGGVMSWRADRLANMRQFAAANGDDPRRPSPATQAKFFMNEDPSLIAKLQSAGSVDEAQQLMNGAWRFAGYDRPGGEAARRTQAANSFLPSFTAATGAQAAIEQQAPLPAPVQVASTDPNFMPQQVMPQPQATDPLMASAAPMQRAPVAPVQTAALGQPQLAPLPPPQSVGANPLPPGMDDPRFDPRTSPQMRAAMISDDFDGLGFKSAQAPADRVASAMPSPSSPAAPTGSIAQVAGAVDAAAQSQGIDPRKLLGIISSPMASEQQRAVAQALLERQMKANAPPTRDDLLAQQKFDYQKAQDERTNKSWQKLDDNTLFNPVTGETKSITLTGGAPTFTGSSVEAQSLNGLIQSGAITKDQALQLGAGKTVSGPNGELLFMTPQGVFGQTPQGGAPQPAGQTSAPSGSPAATPGMIPLTEPKVTIDEKKAQTFADRMMTSGGIIDSMGTKGSGWLDKTAGAYMPFGSDALITSDDYKKVDQAKRDFINAQLRRESGAVIGSDEFANAEKQYFPQPGDTEEVLAQKRQNRQIVIDGMARDGGPTYKAPATPATVTPEVQDLLKKYGP